MLCRYGCFLKWWYPQDTTPKWSFLVGKPPMVVDLLATSTCWLIFMFKQNGDVGLAECQITGEPFRSNLNFFQKTLPSTDTETVFFFSMPGVGKYYILNTFLAVHIHFYSYQFLSISLVIVTLLSIHHMRHEQSKKQPSCLGYIGIYRGWNPTQLLWGLNHEMRIPMNHVIMLSLSKSPC